MKLAKFSRHLMISSRTASSLTTNIGPSSLALAAEYERNLNQIETHRRHSVDTSMETAICFLIQRNNR